MRQITLSKTEVEFFGKNGNNRFRKINTSPVPFIVNVNLFNSLKQYSPNDGIFADHYILCLVMECSSVLKFI